MPIYEFYCPPCHRVFHFLSRTVRTDRRPACPRCGRPDLERKPSVFAISRGLEAPEETGLEGLDDERLDRAMESLAAEVDAIDEDDPRQAAGLLRKLYDATGLDLGPGIEEAIRRMESGEDPERIEEELGHLVDGGDDPETGRARLGRLVRRVVPPTVDETLYEL